MSIKVFFRGPMLFVSDVAAPDEADDVVNRVLIPDATSDSDHEDGSVGVPHTAGLLLVEKGKPNTHIALAGRSIEIAADAENHLPKGDSKFRGVPPVHEMTNPKRTNGGSMQRLKNPATAPIEITFKGGSMSGEMEVTGMELTLHDAAARQWDLTAMPLWESEKATGRITLKGGEGGGGVIELGADVEVYIYNWDVGLPSKKSLRATMDFTNETTDDDFKWIYTLLKPGAQTWKEWLKTDPQLPAPRVKKNSKAFGFTPATCNSARIRGTAVA
jgi:hypothetical protein